jgi:hypothetical protein
MSNPVIIQLVFSLTSICTFWLIIGYVSISLVAFWRVGINHQKREIEREMCHVGHLFSNAMN